MSKSEESAESIEQEVKRLTASLKIGNDYKYFIYMVGLISPENDKNIIKLWQRYEQIFINLAKVDGEVGKKRLLQAIIIFFIHIFPQIEVYAPTFMKFLYDEQEIFAKDFLIAWFDKTIKLDKACILYDRKAEKAFR